MPTIKSLLPDLSAPLADIELKDVQVNKRLRTMSICTASASLDSGQITLLSDKLCKRFGLAAATISQPAPPNSDISSRLQSEQADIIKKLSRERKSTKSNDVILGKKIKGPFIPIGEISPESGKVRTSGEIFCIEYKQRRDNAWIVTVDMTDKHDSITLKLFCDLPARQGEGGFRQRASASKEVLEKRLKKGTYIAVHGDITYDKYMGDYVIMAYDINELPPPPPKTDSAPEKRVELHLHTQMSTMDGMSSATDLVARAASWGLGAVAITDHGVVQAFPEAASAGKKYGIKIIYGVEGYVVDDTAPIVTNPKGATLDDSYVVFDLETTGLSAAHNHIIEIGAVKVVGGEIKDSYSTFVHPPYGIPQKITDLTSITEAMVEGAPEEAEAVAGFLEFAKDSVLVAHNASFDTSFIRAAADRMGRPFDFCYLDTVTLSRRLYPQLHNHKLGTLTKFLNVKLDNHHRAVDDAMATTHIFLAMRKELSVQGIAVIDEINTRFATVDVRGAAAHHIILLAKNEVGLKNLYQLISKSHLDYFYRTPRMPKSVISQYREGLIIGSACESGELYRAIFSGRTPEEISSIVSFYDYLEIQPLGNNEFMLRNGDVDSKEKLCDINRRIIELGRKHNKPVVATGDVHFLDPEDEVYRRVLMAGKGFSDADYQAPLYLRTTEEMLAEFDYLDETTAHEVVIGAPNAIADQIEVIQPTPADKFPPEIEGAQEDIIRMSNERAAEIYGDPLPDIVRQRMDKELYSITTYGFSVMYMIAQKLVSKSLSDGYLVGSRGSVGSSFIAFLSGITEVNALPAHYVCPACKYSEFISDGSGISGCDMPDKTCPVCGTPLNKDGHDIPFETFLGFEGDKEPDIDLNFSGDYQAVAHKYTEELFGEGHVFRAGTIGTIAEKTAFGYVRKYFEERSRVVHSAEIKRLTMGCTGVKRTTGQHPGGIIIVPHHKDIHDFCPVQHPADDAGSDIITTHFDYHSIDKNLLKLDILGHDDPTVIRMLEDLTGIDAKTIPLGEEKTMSLFLNTEALGVTPDQIGSEVGTFGVPEFGTDFVRQMLVDTKPTAFSELLRISGLSHGTDVWLNNAQDYIRSGEITLKEAICTRDDIMIYLLHMGLPPKHAFTIMEKVRKGKGLTGEDEAEMKEFGVPQWYIDSCNKIKYMFPKAHAVAYVMMAFRIAYCKVYYPEAFYTAYFTIRAEGNFDAELMCFGPEKVEQSMREIAAKENASAKEKDVYTILELCREMYARGIQFAPIDLYTSDAKNFVPTPNGILPPLSAMQGISLSAAESIVAEREKGEFFSVDDLRIRTKISKTAIEILQKNGCLRGMPESSQVSLFEL